MEEINLVGIFLDISVLQVHWRAIEYCFKIQSKVTVY